MKDIVVNWVWGLGLSICFYNGKRILGSVLEDEGVGCDERGGKGEWGLYKVKRRMVRR